MVRYERFSMPPCMRKVYETKLGTFTPTVLLIFVLREQICFFQDRFLSIDNPRSLLKFLFLKVRLKG